MKITKLPYDLITGNGWLLSVQLNLAEVTAYIVLSFQNLHQICMPMYVPTKFYFSVLFRLRMIGHWLVGLLNFLERILILGVELWGCFVRISNNGFVMWLLYPLNSQGLIFASAGTNVQKSSHMLSSTVLEHSLALAWCLASSGHRTSIIGINEFLPSQIVNILTTPLGESNLSNVSATFVWEGICWQE